jgi:hypothetical protein
VPSAPPSPPPDALVKSHGHKTFDRHE